MPETRVDEQLRLAQESLRALAEWLEWVGKELAKNSSNNSSVSSQTQDGCQVRSSERHHD